MSKTIVAVRMSGGTEHRHIAGVAVVDNDSSDIEAYTRKRAAIVKSIDDGVEYITRDWKGDVAEVIVVKNTTTGERYIRSRADGELTDNLLRLPRYLLDG